MNTPNDDDDVFDVRAEFEVDDRVIRLYVSGVGQKTVAWDIEPSLACELIADLAKAINDHAHWGANKN